MGPGRGGGARGGGGGGGDGGGGGGGEGAWSDKTQAGRFIGFGNLNTTLLVGAGMLSGLVNG